ncbi:hypothetical protein Godav_022682 [Gossypium davidsonii]|uniref:Uncharacterized protein n=1 Tax=Gossypium davidsonii TaxID=34287 RepID=A0A7J8SP87_GOSDV|nr:hypothetical protein [Gossypium davidsonii]
MALSSAFRERLEHMEHSRNQRLMLLLAEKELQAHKSQVLESKLARIGSMERSCLFLDQKIASQNFKISALKSDIENLDTKYDSSSRKLKGGKERDKFYELKISKMNEFTENVKRFLTETQTRVQELGNSVNELKSTFMELPGNNGYMSSSEIAEAEMKRAELLAMKESLTKTLASNHQRRESCKSRLRICWLHEVQRDGNQSSLAIAKVSDINIADS